MTELSTVSLSASPIKGEAERRERLPWSVKPSRATRLAWDAYSKLLSDHA